MTKKFISYIGPHLLDLVPLQGRLVDGEQGFDEVRSSLAEALPIYGVAAGVPQDVCDHFAMCNETTDLIDERIAIATKQVEVLKESADRADPHAAGRAGRAGLSNPPAPRAGAPPPARAVSFMERRPEPPAIRPTPPPALPGFPLLPRPRSSPPPAPVRYAPARWPRRPARGAFLMNKPVSADFITPPVPTIVAQLRQCAEDLQAAAAADPNTRELAAAHEHVRAALAALEPIAGSTS